ncbi:Imm42 family immunity protein [Celerinatantimonas sp. MCCC 1A17872]|uniref:Imm42 family immunity protein n=1 Tax=Celerinatantimonas sp. MCCC 1A17872 TaxID=3177514 RepID=UPI0038C1A4B3
MVIGDPHKFAIVVDVVDKWSSDGFVSGLFFISIDGYLFPNELNNTVLNSEFFMFFNNSNSSLLTKPVNVTLFNSDKFDAYKELYKITFPEQCDNVSDFLENNYSYLCGFNEMENYGCYIFSVSNGDSVRILGGIVDDELFNQDENGLSKRIIKETFISKTELDNLMYQLKDYYHSLIIK